MARGTGRAVRSEGAAQSRSCADDVALRRWQTVFGAEATSGAGMSPYSAGVRLEVAAECYRIGPRARGRVGGTLRSGGSRGLRILLCPRRAVAGCCEYALGRRPGENCGCSDGARDLRPGCCGGEIMVQKHRERQPIGSARSCCGRRLWRIKHPRGVLQGCAYDGCDADRAPPGARLKTAGRSSRYRNARGSSRRFGISGPVKKLPVCLRRQGFRHGFRSGVGRDFTSRSVPFSGSRRRPCPEVSALFRDAGPVPEYGLSFEDRTLRRGFAASVGRRLSAEGSGAPPLRGGYSAGFSASGTASDSSSSFLEQK